MKIQHSTIEHLAEYSKHLKFLTPEDRYTRFGFVAGEDAIDRLILNILYNSSAHHIFSYYQDEHIVGFGHLVKDGDDWELAVSVEKEYQGQGIANELMKHMIAWGKTHGVNAVFMHCIHDNKKIQHLAKKHGLKAVDRTAGEITAKIQLPAPTVFDYTQNFVREQTELATDIIKLHRSWLKKWTMPYDRVN